MTAAASYMWQLGLARLTAYADAGGKIKEIRAARAAHAVTNTLPATPGSHGLRGPGYCRLVEVVRQVKRLEYAAAAQGMRRFWRRSETDQSRAELARRLGARMAMVNV